MTHDATDMNPRDVYERRMGGEERQRNKIWQTLCQSWFQRFISFEETVLELGAGRCEFINSINAGRKIAVDINEALAEVAGPSVETLVCRSDCLDAIDNSSIDVVFMSNFLEHLDRPTITRTLRECLRVVKPGGRLLVLQPNIRYVWRDYWMFFDHTTALDDRSLCEAVELTGWKIERCVPRFLPYTTKSRLPKSTVLLRVYLKVPILWRLIGGQTFVVARKAETSQDNHSRKKASPQEGM